MKSVFGGFGIEVRIAKLYIWIRADGMGCDLIVIIFRVCLGFGCVSSMLRTYWLFFYGFFFVL